jgi:hypothetical protein
MWHYGKQVDLRTGFWWGGLREGENLRDLGVDGRIILKMNLSGMRRHGLD